MDSNTTLKIIGVLVGLFLIVGGTFLDFTGIGDFIGIPADALGVIIILISLGIF